MPDVLPDDQRRLRRLLAALDGVTEPTASAALERLDLIQYTRLNEHYRPALRLARLILANCTLQDQHGDTAASAFMVDMNQLFEQFVTSRLQRELGGRLEVAAQLRPHLDIDQRLEIRPDLTLRSHGETVGVADLKYKLADSGAKAAGVAAPLARHGDYYQLLAYTTALGLSEGTLIYCADVNRDASHRQPISPAPWDRGVSSAGEAADQRGSAAVLEVSTITVQHLGTKLHTIAVDLSGSPRDIDAQIAALAEHLADTAATSVG